MENLNDVKHKLQPILFFKFNLKHDELQIIYYLLFIKRVNSQKLF